jgi:uncharacterized UPF0160 family protein
MKIVTHDSSFHSDDTFAVATLLLKFPDAEVIRSRSVEVQATADYVLDTGMEYDPKRGRFDHHMPEGGGVRDNGIPYASFGLVWKEFGVELAGGVREAEVMDKRLVQPVDAHDNGMAIAEYKFEEVREYTIGDFFFSFLSGSDVGDERLYEIFMNNVATAKALLIREINRSKEMVEGEGLVREVYEQSKDKRVIELPNGDLPWKYVLSKLPEPLYVMYLARDGKWRLKGVPDADKPYGSLRKPLPEAWFGKEKEELQEITGVTDAIFTHRTGFMAACESKEGALKLAQIALSA